MSEGQWKTERVGVVIGCMWHMLCRADVLCRVQKLFEMVLATELCLFNLGSIVFTYPCILRGGGTLNPPLK